MSNKEALLDNVARLRVWDGLSPGRLIPLLESAELVAHLPTVGLPELRTTRIESGGVRLDLPVGRDNPGLASKRSDLEKSRSSRVRSWPTSPAITETV